MELDFVLRSFIHTPVVISRDIYNLNNNNTNNNDSGSGSTVSAFENINRESRFRENVFLDCIADTNGFDKYVYHITLFHIYHTVLTSFGIITTLLKRADESLCDECVLV